MKHTTYQHPSGEYFTPSLPEIEKRGECPPAWPWGLVGFVLGLTLYHFFVLPVILN